MNKLPGNSPPRRHHKIRGRSNGLAKTTLDQGLIKEKITLETGPMSFSEREDANNSNCYGRRVQSPPCQIDLTPYEQ